MAEAKDNAAEGPVKTETKVKVGPTTAVDTTGKPTHVRFIGHPSDDENSSTSLFGKVFYRGKWVPIANLNGGNPEKKALSEDLLKKLLGNPAFQLGHGEDLPIPGVTATTEDAALEEA